MPRLLSLKIPGSQVYLRVASSQYRVSYLSAYGSTQGLIITHESSATAACRAIGIFDTERTRHNAIRPDGNGMQVTMRR